MNLQDITAPLQHPKLASPPTVLLLGGHRSSTSSQVQKQRAVRRQDRSRQIAAPLLGHLETCVGSLQANFEVVLEPGGFLCFEQLLGGIGCCLRRQDHCRVARVLRGLFHDSRLLILFSEEDLVDRLLNGFVLVPQAFGVAEEVDRDSL